MPKSLNSKFVHIYSLKERTNLGLLKHLRRFNKPCKFGLFTAPAVKIALLLPASIFYLLLIFNCSHTRPYYRSDAAQSAEIKEPQEVFDYRILLIGDAGAPKKIEPVLETLRQWAAVQPQRTLIVFLGDNVYPSGVPNKEDPWRKEAERRLSVQIDVIKKSGAQGFFIPGNHDRGNDREASAVTLKRQQRFINQALPGGQHVLPPDGCPGPVKFDFHGMRIIAIDTNWWFDPTAPTHCSQNDKQAVLKELARLAATANGREVLITAHHPLATHGPHGGFFSWKDHLFPLTRLVNWLWIPTPVLGSLYPLIRWHVVRSDQDLAGKKYQDLIRQFTKTLSPHQVLAYAAGHEHALQVLEGGRAAKYILVSGLGSSSKATAVGHGENTLFAHLHPGFMALDGFKDGRVLLQVVEPGDPEVVFRKWLKEDQSDGK